MSPAPASLVFLVVAAVALAPERSRDEFHPFCNRPGRICGGPAEPAAEIRSSPITKRVKFIPASFFQADAVLRAASAWALAYRGEVAFLIADEEYRQTRLDRAGATVESRLLRGELFLTYLEADDAWIAVHDVAEMDGVPVADRQHFLQRIARGDELRGLARQVAEHNARFNLGGVSRNFNEPTLPLQLLDPDRAGQLDASVARIERSPDGRLATLAYRERGNPTLVRGPEGPIRARGEMVIDVDTGQVHRTRFELRQGDVQAELVTTYGRDERLDAWVPLTFVERYEGSPDGRGETIVCEARYTNYRRFTVLARIKN